MMTGPGHQHVPGRRADELARDRSRARTSTATSKRCSPRAPAASSWILCTHTHLDHSPAAPAHQGGDRRDRHGPAGAAGTSQDQTFAPDRVLERRRAPRTLGGVTLRAIHTPGHASNHLCYLLEETRMLFTGDHVMQGSTVVINPPDGDMRAYLASLETLLDEDARDPRARATAISSARPHKEVCAPDRASPRRAKRRWSRRCERLARPTLDELVPVVYDDVSPKLHPGGGALAHRAPRQAGGRGARARAGRAAGAARSAMLRFGDCRRTRHEHEHEKTMKTGHQPRSQRRSRRRLAEVRNAGAGEANLPDLAVAASPASRACRARRSSSASRNALKWLADKPEHKSLCGPARAGRAQPPEPLSKPAGQHPMSRYDFDLFTHRRRLRRRAREPRLPPATARSVAVAEESYFGGTCVNVGCIPKKLFSYAAHFRDDFHDAAGFGWSAAAARVRLAHAGRQQGPGDRAPERHLRAPARQGRRRRSCSARATVVDPHTVEVRRQDRTPQSTSSSPPARGRRCRTFPAREHAITSNEAFHLRALPERVARGRRRLHRGRVRLDLPRPGRGDDARPTAASACCAASTPSSASASGRGDDEEGHDDLRFESRPRGASRKSRRHSAVTFTRRQHAQEADLVHVRHRPHAQHRQPRPGDSRRGAGAQTAPSWSTSTPRAAVDSIHAIGDVTNRINLTPVATAEGMALAKTLFRGEPTPSTTTTCATAVFAIPNIATVGLSEEQARARLRRGRHLQDARSARSSTRMPDSKEKTFMKLVVDAQTQRVLGAHMMGAGRRRDHPGHRHRAEAAAPPRRSSTPPSASIPPRRRSSSRCGRRRQARRPAGGTAG